MKQLVKKTAVFFLCLSMAVLIGKWDVQAASVGLSKASLTMSVKGNTVLKVNGTTAKAVWSSSNTKVASVSQGTVTAKKAGSATITAAVGNKKYSCKVTVKNNCAALYKKLLETDRYAAWYYVLDIDKNGVPELITGFGGNGRGSFKVYTVKSGKAVKAGEYSVKNVSTNPLVFRYSSKYKTIYSWGSSGSSRGVGIWWELYNLSGTSLKPKYYVCTVDSGKFTYYAGTSRTNYKKVSKASYESYYKKYIAGYKEYKMSANTASNRTKSFG